MHRGERRIIFAPPLSSKAKWLTHLAPLLEHIFLMHSDLRDANLLLHSVVEVSLEQTTSCLCLLCDSRRVIFANAYWS
jgi:hypothetical protein